VEVFFYIFISSHTLVNPLRIILKPQSNEPYSNTVIGPLAVDGWAATFGTARRGLGGLLHIIRCDTMNIVIAAAF